MPTLEEDPSYWPPPARNASSMSFSEGCWPPVGAPSSRNVPGSGRGACCQVALAPKPAPCAPPGIPGTTGLWPVGRSERELPQAAGPAGAACDPGEYMGYAPGTVPGSGPDAGCPPFGGPLNPLLGGPKDGDPGEGGGEAAGSAKAASQSGIWIPAPTPGGEPAGPAGGIIV